jgi:hypothetical protein
MIMNFHQISELSTSGYRSTLTCNYVIVWYVKIASTSKTKQAKKTKHK